MGNRYIAAGQCPFCYGQGWVGNCPCEDCGGTGTMDGLWATHDNQLRIRMRQVDDDGML